ncbi:hypothetical protein LEMLEM_LOCUS1553, partial [Lemmus lemmus]
MTQLSGRNKRSRIPCKCTEGKGSQKTYSATQRGQSTCARQKAFGFLCPLTYAG